MNIESQNYWKSLINISLNKFFILQTLHKGPIYGYALLENLSCFTKGCCSPTYGTIYPILNELAKGKYATVKVEKIGARKRKIYQLTEKGENAYKEALKVWQEVVPYLIKVIKEDII